MFISGSLEMYFVYGTSVFYRSDEIFFALIFGLACLLELCQLVSSSSRVVMVPQQHVMKLI